MWIRTLFLFACLYWENLQDQRSTVWTVHFFYYKDVFFRFKPQKATWKMVTVTYLIFVWCFFHKFLTIKKIEKNTYYRQLLLSTDPAATFLKLSRHFVKCHKYFEIIHRSRKIVCLIYPMFRIAKYYCFIILCSFKFGII